MNLQEKLDPKDLEKIKNKEDFIKYYKSLSLKDKEDLLLGLASKDKDIRNIILKYIKEDKEIKSTNISLQEQIEMFLNEGVSVEDQALWNLEEVYINPKIFYNDFNKGLKKLEKLKDTDYKTVKVHLTKIKDTDKGYKKEAEKAIKEFDNIYSMFKDSFDIFNKIKIGFTPKQVIDITNKTDRYETLSLSQAEEQINKYRNLTIQGDIDLQILFKDGKVVEKELG